MGRRDYDRLGVEEFGEHLILTGDLDPVYIALVRADLDRDTRHRWLVAYWCLYHCGAASWISEQTGHSFWEALLHAADNDIPAPTGSRWPRGHERRHFRGQQGHRAVVELAQRYGALPECMVREVGLMHVPAHDHREFLAISRQVRRHRGFGPWIAFKVADMLERVERVTVDFTGAELLMFTDPVRAARLLWDQWHLGLVPAAALTDEAIITEVVQRLLEHFSQLKAPPHADRPVGVQEVETILCKWKSHQNGHYPLWNDTDEINEGLQPWLEHSSVAREFAAAMPKRQT